MVHTDTRQMTELESAAYPQIEDAERLAACVPGAGLIEAFGFQGADRRRALKRLLTSAEQGKKVLLLNGRRCPGPDRSRLSRKAQAENTLVVVLEQEPSGWPSDGALLFLDGMPENQSRELMRKLYDTDRLVLGLVTEEALSETGGSLS